jgi:hypothetical protein
MAALSSRHWVADDKAPASIPESSLLLLGRSFECWMNTLTRNNQHLSYSSLLHHKLTETYYINYIKKNTSPMICAKEDGRDLIFPGLCFPNAFKYITLYKYISNLMQ